MKNKKISIKKSVIISVLFILAIVILLFLSGCLATDIPQITVTDEAESRILQNTISVNGNGSVKVLPDEVFIHVAVISEKPTTQETVDENSNLSKKIIDEIKKVSAENLNIQTISYELYPLYDYSEENTSPKIYAYRASSTIEVTTTDLEKIGDIIARATEFGATNISNIGFDLTDATRRTAKNNALAAATTDANDKAIAIANSMGLKIDTVLYINEGETVIPIPFSVAPRYGDLKAKEVAAPTILPQEIEVTATVNIVYLFSK